MSTLFRLGWWLGRVPIRKGATAGVVAYITGLLLVGILGIVDPETDPGPGGAETVTDIGLLFYASHFVDMRTTTETSAGTESETYSLFAESATQIPALGFSLVPAVVLLVTGYVVASRFGDGSESSRSVLAGASVVIGYLPLALAGTALFEYAGGFEGYHVTIGPDLAQSIALAGLLFPLVFGAIGGYVAYTRVE